MADKGPKPSEALASNVHDYRGLQRLSQRQLAEEMRKLGHRWHQQSVSGVEAGARPVTTDELVALALVLAVSLTDLLDPAGPTGRGAGGWTLGEDEAAVPMSPEFVRKFLEGAPFSFDGTQAKIDLLDAEAMSRWLGQ